MKRILLFTIFHFLFSFSFAQGNMFTCISDKVTDLASNSTMKLLSTITIDSTLITIEQGTNHIYLDVKKIDPHPEDDAYYFNLKTFDEKDAFGALSIGKMIFTYQATVDGQPATLNYMLIDVQKNKAAIQQEILNDSTMGEIDSFAVDDTLVHSDFDVAPQFPGGSGAMIKFVQDNAKYPKNATVKGFVQVTAVIEKDGTVTQVKVKKDIGQGCGAAAVAAVKMMPAWSPGEKDKEPVRCRVNINVNFMPK